MTIKFKLRFLAAATAFCFFLPGVASATVLTFDSILGKTPGSAYSESGYTFTLSYLKPPGPHYGDGSGMTEVFDWHDGGGNGIGVQLILRKDSGSNFDFLSFDLVQLDDFTDLTVSAVDYAPQVLSATGSYMPNFLNVSSVTFDLTDGSHLGAAIDNVHAVTEPASLALLGLGLAGIGFARRNKCSR